MSILTEVRDRLALFLFCRRHDGDVPAGRAKARRSFLGKLFEKITDPNHLLASYQLIREKYYNPYLRLYLKFVPGIDGVDFFEFDRRIDQSLEECRRFLLQAGRPFQPLILRRIPKDVPGKYREIYLMTLRDRVIQKALAEGLASSLDRFFYPNLYSYRKGKFFGTMAAARKVRLFLKEHQPPVYAFKTDIKDYFDSMNQRRLLTTFERYLPDEPEVLSLLDKFLHQQRSFDGILSSPIQGISTGSSLSPFCANLFLVDLDARMFRTGHTYLRYGDDIVLLAETKETLEKGRNLILEQLHQNGLHLSEGKTCITSSDQPLDYLGYRFANGRVQVGETAIKRFRRWIIEQLPRYRYQNASNRTEEDKKALLKRILSDLYASAMDSLGSRQLPWIKGFPVVNDDQSIRALDRFIKKRIRLCISGGDSSKNYASIPESWFREAGFQSLTALYYRVTRRRPFRRYRSWHAYAAHHLNFL